MTKAVPSATLRQTDPNKRWADVNRRLNQVEFGDPVPSFWAKMTTNVVVADGTTEQLEFDDWEIGDRRFFEDSGGINAGKLATLEILIPGVYAFFLGIDWIGNWVGVRSMGIFDTWANTCEFGKKTTDTDDDIGSGGYLTHSYVTHVPGFEGADPINPPGQTQMIPFVEAYQESGAPRTIETAVWGIYYLGYNSFASIVCA